MMDRRNFVTLEFLASSEDGGSRVRQLWNKELCSIDDAIVNALIDEYLEKVRDCIRAELGFEGSKKGA